MTYTSSFFQEMTSDSLASAKVVVPLVMNLLHPSTVIDVGCGMGAWLSIFGEQGRTTICGLDGFYVDRASLLIPADCFRATDLAQPFTCPERFDLAVSLEVAEHLPACSARGFVKSLCRLAPVVLFSGAIPGQGGTHHVNEQWPEYWRKLFAGQNFRMFDPFRPQLWHDERVTSHYRQNMFLFIHRDLLDSRPELHCLPEVKDGNGLMLVDPFILFSIRATLKRLPFMVWNSIGRRVERFLFGGRKSGTSEPAVAREFLPR